MGLRSQGSDAMFSVGDSVLIDNMKVKLSLNSVAKHHKPQGLVYRYGWIPPDNSIGRIVTIGNYWYGDNLLHWYGVVVGTDYFPVDEWGLTKVIKG